MDTSSAPAKPPPLPPRQAAAISKPAQELPPPDQRPHELHTHRPRTTSDVSGEAIDERPQQSTLRNSSKVPAPAPAPAPAAAAATLNGDNEETIAAHYAYMQRHVRGMKRTQVVGLKAPEFKDYTVQNEDGSNRTTTTTIQWREFIEAWVQYIIQSFASGQVDDELEPFSLKIIKSGADRLYGLAMPLQGPAMGIRRVYRWENRWTTGFLGSCYLCLWYNDLIVPFVFAAIIAYCIHVRLDMLAQFGVEALATAASEEPDPSSSSNASPDGEEESGKSGHMRQFWKLLRCDLMSSDMNHDDDNTAFDHRSLNDWLGDIRRMYGPKGQLMLLDMVDRLERIKNLVTWKRPEKTTQLLLLLSGTVLFFLLLPTRYVTKLFFFYIGFEFFVLQALRSHYPRHRRLFNVIDWILWGVPNDAEYAMEVIRLHRFTVDSLPSTNTHNKRASLPNPSSKDTPQPPATSATTIPPPPAVDPTAGKEKPTASTAATLAMMVAGAAIGQAKTAIDEKLNRTHTSFSGEDGEPLSQQNRTSGSSSSSISTAIRPGISSKDLLARKGSQGTRDGANEEDPETFETYGCVYKGSIPGRLVLLKSGLQFRTSRVTGARVLVYYYWRDIASVRKTKSINVLVWHTNGLSIKTVDGEELDFDNVIKRDDCFNRLLAAAGDQWR